MLAAGTRFDRYLIEGVLGEGGMGVVYRARDEKLRRSVALKVVRGETSADGAAAQERMLREARATAALHHPNVIVLHDVGEFEGATFLAMELLSGATLRATLAAPREPPTQAQRLRWLLEVARALAAAHDAGLVHRDVKPDNVFITDLGVAKVLDFGIARRTEREALPSPRGPEPPLPLESETTLTSTGRATPASQGTTAPSAASTQGERGEHPATDTFATAAGALVGTPLYMAPEQLRAQPVDERTDQFAWGVLAYEVLSGALPWRTTQEYGRIEAILVQEPEPLAERLAPEAVRLAVLRALRKQPAERFASMADVVRVLEAALDAPTEKRRSNGRALRIAGALALVAAALGAAGALRRAWAQRHPLSAPNSVLACPPLEVSGIEAPGAWFGAAAASLVCLRASAYLGCSDERVLLPAELVDAPRTLSDSLPFDPYAAQGARERALRAARTRGSAWVDGRVARNGWNFEVSLVLRSPSGDALASGSGRSTRMHWAVRDATSALAATGVLPLVPPTQEFLRWNRWPSGASVLPLVDASISSLFGPLSREECLALLERPALPSGLRTTVAHGCSAALGRPPRERTSLDRSSPEALVTTLPAAMLSDPPSLEQQRALVQQLRALLEREASVVGREHLGQALVGLLRSVGEPGAARSAATQFAEAHPKAYGAWSMLTFLSFMQPESQAVYRAAQLWEPYTPGAWGAAAFETPYEDVERRLLLRAREHALTPWLLPTAHGYSEDLLRAGHTAEARALASRLAEGSPAERAASELQFAEIEAREAAFGRALARVRRLLSEREGIGESGGTLSRAMHLALDLSLMTGQHEEVADEVVRRHVLAQPSKVVGGDSAGAWDTAMVCALSSPAVRLACSDTLQRQLREGYFPHPAENVVGWVAGTERYAHGDVPGMAAAWRAVARNPGFRLLMAHVLESVGEHELSATVDEGGRRDTYNGATLVLVREARRATRAGDRERARALAREVIAAWHTSDVALPALAEMSAIVAPGS